MNLQKKIGQMLFAGFQGTTVTPELRKLIEDYHIGGVIFFTRNIEDVFQLADLIYEIQEIACNKTDGVPLLIGVDQEGGRVARIKEPFTVFPPARILGRSRSEELAYKQGMIQAIEIKALGFNIDFAPVLDVDTNTENPVIGDRAFGSDAGLVSLLGCSVIKGLQENGVAACGKHFPGHGDASVDSHLELPALIHDIERLKRLELAPFNAAIKEGVESIMTAHICFPEIDSEKIPAAFSEKIINGILRKESGFKGVVFSDDLEMKAVENNFTIEDASVRSIKAGIDMLLICRSYEKQIKAFEAILKGVENGEISKKLIEKSNRRISVLKRKYAEKIEKPDSKELLKVLGSEEHRKIAVKIAEMK